MVARSHYLGKLKRRMQNASLIFANESAVVLPNIGVDVLSSIDNQPAGQVVGVGLNLLHAHKVDILYEVSLPMLADGAELSIEGIDAQWQRGELPYTLSDA